MAGLLRAARVFWVVPPLPPLMTPAFAVTTIAAAAGVAADVARAGEVLTPVLLLHTFACAAGVLAPARRGHFDLLWTAGVGRRTAALVHGAFAAAPGVVSWLALALVEAAVARTSRGALTAAGTGAAMILTTVLPWLLSVRLPRFAAAIGWLVVLAFAVVSNRIGDLLAGPPAGGGLLTAAAAVLYPPLLVGRPLHGPEGTALAVVLAAAAAGVAAALAWIDRQDITLEAAP